MTGAPPTIPIAANASCQATGEEWQALFAEDSPEPQESNFTQTT